MRMLHPLPLATLALSLASCGGTQNRGLESVHQPVVSRTDYVYDMGGNGGLSAEDTHRLQGWFETLHVGYGDHIAVDDPSGNPSNRDAVAAVAGRYGLLLDETAPVTDGTLAPGAFRVVVSRAHAEVPGCPDWSRTSQPEFNAHTMSNYGCALNSNLAAMVANPEDLIHGASGQADIDATTAGKAIKTYRAAAPKTMETPSTRNGN
ncbi:MAG: CpaD family pilus assembly protein [Sphingomonadaceae bacterium]|nr:CpaD family pilus assembly protein [Sphingomonadaceae bacterium]